MQITKDNYINAHFLDANRTLIEVTTKEGVQAIHFNPEHPVYQDLSKVVDIETIHSNTKRYLKEPSKAMPFIDPPDNINVSYPINFFIIILYI